MNNNPKRTLGKIEVAGVVGVKPAFPRCQDHADWKTLYTAAVVETNKNLIPQRVSAAEAAILARGRELFGTYGTGEEKESLRDALFVLHAFRMDLEHTEVAQDHSSR